MKVPIYDIEGKEIEEADLPAIFSADYRPDLIKKAFYALKSHSLQPQGRDPMAGMRTSAQSWNTGRGVSRIARVKGERHPRSGQAAGVASVVHGRQAHHPVAEKVVWQDINRKERRVALISAIAATAKKDVVSARGHKVDGIENLPLVVSDDIQSISKAKDLRPIFANLKLEQEFERISSRRKSYSGTPRLRGRKKRQAVGPLIVVASDLGICKAAGAFPGVSATLAKDLSTLDLAPGSHPGRLTIWSKSALGALPRALYERVRFVAS